MVHYRIKCNTGYLFNTHKQNIIKSFLLKVLNTFMRIKKQWQLS